MWGVGRRGVFKETEMARSAVSAIEQKWGLQAIRRGEPGLQAKFPHISTRFQNLDQILAGIGGIPRDRMTKLLSAPTFDGPAPGRSFRDRKALSPLGQLIQVIRFG